MKLRFLGRHIEHDPVSLQFPAARAAALVSVKHERKCAPFDQGQLGSCTGNAMAGLLMTLPYFVPGRVLDEKTAVSLYEAATRLDKVPGHYPPTDTGSSGLAVMKAAKQSGYIKAYHHAFGLQHALAALVLSPVIVGVNWYEGFDTPDSDGLVKISGTVRGGHEFEVLELDVENQTVTACNSWGTGWGKNGYFTFSWSDFDRLLKEKGDVTVAV
jgi:hypothetical protein